MGDLNTRMSELVFEELDTVALAQAKDENAFLSSCLKNLNSTYKIIEFITNIERTTGYSKKEIIIIGQMHRLGDLLNSLLIVQNVNNGNLNTIFCRLIFETCVNAIYFSELANDEEFDDYVEEAFLNRIKLIKYVENDQNKTDIQQNIADRINKSIECFRLQSDVSLDSIKSRKKNTWAQKDLFSKSVQTGFGDHYNSAYGMSSDHVHGSWFDLISLGVKKSKTGRFELERIQPPVRPQSLNAIQIFIAEAIKSYANYFGILEIRDELTFKCDKVINMTKELALIHESYLNAREWPKI